tara:strand:- start:2867 stop:3550 length:684 start_codon:yes stop_codon:yes gene_type:complete
MVFQPDARLHLGAEAEVWAGLWMGRPAVRKIRRHRAWRHPDLEKRLGYRRMLSEARILIRIKDAGLPVPAVWDVDLENGRIVMQQMAGKPLIEILRDNDISESNKHLALENSGAAVRMLHRMAVTHGDLSTNNILIDKAFDAYLIDFGLSAVEYEVERFGIDLHVMDEILGASHPNIAKGIEIFLSGYVNCDNSLGPLVELSGGMPPLAGEVLKRLDDVRSRVRYHG